MKLSFWSGLVLVAGLLMPSFALAQAQPVMPAVATKTRPAVVTVACGTNACRSGYATLTVRTDQVEGTHVSALEIYLVGLDGEEGVRLATVAFYPPAKNGEENSYLVSLQGNSRGAVRVAVRLAAASKETALVGNPRVAVVSAVPYKLPPKRS